MKTRAAASRGGPRPATEVMSGHPARGRVVDLLDSHRRDSSDRKKRAVAVPDSSEALEHRYGATS